VEFAIQQLSRDEETFSGFEGHSRALQLAAKTDRDRETSKGGNFSRLD